jgi:hypothetical protein
LAGQRLARRANLLALVVPHFCDATFAAWRARREDQVALMDKTIAQLNVEHFRRLLANETSEEKRQVILKLLAQEEAKLEAFTGPADHGLPANKPRRNDN